jgi:hypothetical protein
LQKYVELLNGASNVLAISSFFTAYAVAMAVPAPS